MCQMCLARGQPFLARDDLMWLHGGYSFVSAPQARRSDPCLAATPFLLRLLLAERLQVREAGLELPADHLVHVENETHHLPEEAIGTVNGPSDVCADVRAGVRGLSLRCHRDLGRVVGLERLEKIHLEDDLG